MKYILTVLFLLLSTWACNNNNTQHLNNSDSLKPIDKPTTIHKSNFDTLAVSQGDLNSDNNPDLVIIFTKKGEDTAFNPAPTRPVEILFGQNDHSYTLICSSDSVVMTHDMGGVSEAEPFAYLKIENGVMSIQHNGSMGSFHWLLTVSFRYSLTDKVFYVDKIITEQEKYSDNISEATHETVVKTKKDFGKLPFSRYSVFKSD